MTIKEKMESVGAHTSGFDYLRIFLALAILTWHSIWLSGENNLNGRIASGDFQFIHNCLVPCFFALSGFLVSGSLLRNTIPQFITLRIIRIVPALAVEVLICAIILGGIFTSFPLRQYFSHPEFRAYFLNIVGDIHYTLPGVFEHSPAGPKINIQLWTIPFELWCYVALVLCRFGFFVDFGIDKTKGYFFKFCCFCIIFDNSVWCFGGECLRTR